MKKIIHKKLTPTLFVLMMIISCQLKSQDLDGNFAIGLHVASVLYSKKDGPTVGGRYIATLPGISISKYLGNKMTISATFSQSINDVQEYVSSDFNLSYDVLSPERKLRPYILGGFGIVSLLDSGFTLNLGAGSTLWVTERIGLNGQMIYKASVFGTEFQKSHIFGSVGISYSFVLGGSKRLWE